MTVAALMTFAWTYGVPAVNYVILNAWWLVPMGMRALDIIRGMFG